VNVRFHPVEVLVMQRVDIVNSSIASIPLVHLAPTLEGLEYIPSPLSVQGITGQLECDIERFDRFRPQNVARIDGWCLVRSRCVVCTW